MMRISPLTALLALSALAGPAYALQGSDTMAAWRRASADEKNKVVVELLKEDGRESGFASVVKCLDQAAGAPGHGGLTIAELVKACKSDGTDPA